MCSLAEPKTAVSPLACTVQGSNKLRLTCPLECHRELSREQGPRRAWGASPKTYSMHGQPLAATRARDRVSTPPRGMKVVDLRNTSRSTKTTNKKAIMVKVESMTATVTRPRRTRTA